MANFRIKFFGSKNRKKQIKQVKMNVECKSSEEVESILKNSYGYEVINGLKIHNINNMKNTFIILIMLFSLLGCNNKKEYVVKQPAVFTEKVDTNKTLPKGVKKKTLKAEKVDLNDYLGYIDPTTDWNYTDLGSYEASILEKNHIYYDDEKGYWVKK